MAEHLAHEFSPAPMYDSAWWRRQPLDNTGFMVLGELREGLQATPTALSVVVPSCVDGEPWPDPYCYPSVFPTFTDLVLWIRWCGLPMEERLVELYATSDDPHDEVLDGFCGEEVALTGARLEIARMIDEAPAGTDARELVERLFEASQALFEPDINPYTRERTGAWVLAGQVLLTSMTIHEFMRSVVEEWERDLADHPVDEWSVNPRVALGLDGEGVSFDGAQWSMPPEVWAQVPEGFHKLSIYPGF